MQKPDTNTNRVKITQTDGELVMYTHTDGEYIKTDNNVNATDWR